MTMIDPVTGYKEGDVVQFTLPTSSGEKYEAIIISVTPFGTAMVDIPDVTAASGYVRRHVPFEYLTKVG